MAKLNFVFLVTLIALHLFLNTKKVTKSSNARSLSPRVRARFRFFLSFSNNDSTCPICWSCYEGVKLSTRNDGVFFFLKPGLEGLKEFNSSIWNQWKKLSASHRRTLCFDCFDSFLILTCKEEVVKRWQLAISYLFL